MRGVPARFGPGVRARRVAAREETDVNFKENRAVAWVVFALCVIFSLSFSGGRALTNLRQDVGDIFYNGVTGDGLCIDKDLTVRSENAYNIASTASGYASIDAALVSAAKDASNELAAAETIGARYAANVKCQRAVEDLYTAIDNASLSEKDSAFAYKEYKEFQSRADTISRDPYNQRAQAFNQTLSGFPASLLGGLQGVKPLELFS